ncbi:unnamed protein product [Strongylus vulgaris]|uniref:Uncharacterized protein n=1 Tax=Strongylus vulgaris TaxID=40348 RepID=A0A3P7KPF6_STRVU|nr:unnamed protein product [Strongylus vulgaris]
MNYVVRRHGADFANGTHIVRKDAVVGQGGTRMLWWRGGIAGYVCVDDAGVPGSVLD